MKKFIFILALSLIFSNVQAEEVGTLNIKGDTYLEKLLNKSVLGTNASGKIIESSASGESTTVSDTTTVNLTLTGSNITADGLYTAGDHITLTGADFDVDDDFVLNTTDTMSGNLTATNLYATSTVSGVTVLKSGVPVITGNQSITLSGDVSGSGNTTITTVVADDSHAHTGATLSGIDISLDTNLTAGDHITLTDDDLDVDDDFVLNTSDTMSGSLNVANTVTGIVVDTQRLENSAGDLSIIASGGDVKIGIVGTGSGSTSPKTLSLGSTFSTQFGLNPKLMVYQDNTAPPDNFYGFGVSGNPNPLSMDYMVPFNKFHTFYSGAVQMLNIGSNGLTFGNFNISPVVAYSGDSLTEGYLCTHPYNYYMTLPDYNGIAFTEYNLGVSGQTAEYALEYGQVDSYYSAWAGRNILVVWLGAADIVLYSANAQQTFSYLEEFCRNRRRAGWKVIVCTMISSVDHDTDKNTYNALIRANWTNFADGLADIATDEPLLGADGAYSNTTYFNVDQLHLTDTGTALIAPVVQAAIENLNDETTKNHKHFRLTVIDPATVYGIATGIIVVPELDTPIRITNLEVTCNNDPATEPTGDIKYADNFRTQANSMLINSFDTMGGSLSDNTIATGIVAVGKTIYIQFDTTPDTTIKQMGFDLTYD